MSNALQQVRSAIEALLQQRPFVLVAIDGRCGAGKTTLARELQQALGCNVIHMDDFFLRPFQRTEERLQTPGGNVDYERFFSEVLLPLSKNEAFCYRPYVCTTQTLAQPVCVTPNRVTIIEGSYACHPTLWDFYHLRVFLDVDEATQAERILARNGAEAARVFAQKWIPLEERYFEAYSLRERADLTL